MKPLAYLHQGRAEGYAALLAGLSPHGVPVVAAEPGAGLADALKGLLPLGFSGALIEGEGLEAAAAAALERLDPEAREAARVDAVATGWSGLRGLYLAPRALAELLGRVGYPGLRAVWLGSPRPELAEGLRNVGRLDVAAALPAEGEAFLRRFAPPVRGALAVGAGEVRALAAEADLVIYAGGPLPAGALAPYHTLLALAPVAPEVVDAVETVLGPEVFRAHRLALAVRELVGLSLPPEAFLDL